MSILDKLVEQRARRISLEIDGFYSRCVASFLASEEISWWHKFLARYFHKKHLRIEQHMLFDSEEILIKIWFEARGTMILLGSKTINY